MAKRRCRSRWLAAGAFLIAAAGVLLVPPGGLDARAASEGLVELTIEKPFAQAWKDLEAAVKANKMGIVARASASRGAAARGITIPGNAVIGVYRNDFAVKMLEASLQAGIEAPIRFYLTENADGTTALSYKTPSAVFASYGSDDLNSLAKELDMIFAAIAEAAGGVSR